MTTKRLAGLSEASPMTILPDLTAVTHPDRSMFAEPHGHSSLRAPTRRNPRNLPCPSCGTPNRLTPADHARGYQCDQCADALEGAGDWAHW